MSDTTGHDVVKLPSSSRSRHQIKRSITELASPVRLHLHNHHHNPHYRKDRHHDDAVTQSASARFPPRSSFDVVRPASGFTPVMSPNQSRRASIMAHREEDGLLPVAKQQQSQEKLQQETEEAELRVEGLKQSLDHLHTFSMSTTKRLDETHYSLLEKTSALRNTIAAMKDLAEMSRDIHGDFERSAQGLKDDVLKQLDAVGQFEQQEGKVEALQGRIRSGRARMQSLSGRVDAVRERIEGWASADKAWQDKTRKRLKVIWLVVVVVLLFAVALLLGAANQERNSAGTVFGRVPDIRPIGTAAADSASAEKDLPAHPGVRNGDDSYPVGKVPSGMPRQHSVDDGFESSGTLEWEPVGGGDGRLRMFDEL